MNIPNVGTTADTAKAAVETVQNGAREQQAKSTAPSAMQKQSALQKDEYVPAAENRVNNAVYDVKNVSRGVISQLNQQLKVGQVTASGERIEKKVVEILLPTGRKSLTIYRKQR